MCKDEPPDFDRCPFSFPLGDFLGLESETILTVGREHHRMQFKKDGPDIPERLLQAHEDGRVVFFCGAGISFPARLPSFAQLVDQLYHDLGERSEPCAESRDQGRPTRHRSGSP